MYDNHLKSLPAEVGNLANLQNLELYNNQLSGPIPAFLSKLDNLYYLTLNGNPDLTCWETRAARDWALSLGYYDGPTCYLP
jgi:Leucine-rich repeat (LRR) protein